MKRLITTLTAALLMIAAPQAFAQPTESASDAAPAVETHADAMPAATPEAPSAAALEVPAEDGKDEAQEGYTNKEAISTGKEILEAARAGKWLIALGALLLLVVGLLRRFSDKLGKGKLRGYALAVGLPMAAAVGVSLQTGAWSVEVFVSALVAGLTGIGLHTAAKDAKAARAAKSEG